MAAVLAVHLVMAAVFAFLYAKAPEDAPHMRLWAISWGVGAVRYVGAFAGAATGMAEHANRVAYLTLLVSGLLFMAGTYRYLRREMPSAWIGGAALAAIWILVSWGLQITGHRLPFIVETLPSFLFMGSVDLWTGAVVLRSRNLGSVRHVMGWALVVWGVHRCDYPFLRPFEAFAPWGFGLAAVLGMIVAVGMLLLYFERAWTETRDSEERYRSIFENAIEGMFQVGPDGGFLAVNPALQRMLGYASAVELGARSLTLDVLSPASRDAEGRLQALASEPLGVEIELVDAEFARLTAHLHLRAVEGPAGRFYEGSVRDVTQAKRLQQQLVQSQKLEALGRLAGGVAHDFNNVLTAMLAGSELAEIAWRKGEDPSSELERIREAGKRAADLTGQLLAFSRNQSTLPATRALDLNAAVTAALAILERLIGEDIRLEVELVPEAPRVRASSAQLEQIVLNLAINARDAMPEGGRLRVSTACVERDGVDLVQLVVCDDGEGIDSEVQEHMFDPFFTTKSTGKGTGLGLSTVYGIVSALGGEIEVESSPGAGATFRLLLPACDEEPTSGGAEGRGAPRANTAVLLAEDEEAVREATERLLAHAGYQVLSAGDMQSALTCSREHAGPLSALVSDIVMPEGSGVELAGRLREERPGLPVLFVSGYAAGELERLRSFPNAGFLSKPYTSDQLLEALAEVIERSGEGLPGDTPARA